MKKTIVILLLTVFTILFQSFLPLPWWAFAVELFVLGCLVPLTRWSMNPFVTGFCVGMLSWLVPGIIIHFNGDGNILAAVSELIHLPVFLLFVLMALMGGFIGGLSLLAGFQLRNGKEVLELRLDHQPRSIHIDPLQKNEN